MNWHDMKKQIIKYAIGLILAGIVIKLFIGQEQINLLKRISVFDLIISLFLTALIFLVSGIRYSFLLHVQSKKKLSFADTFLFPVTTNLWGVIIPLQGGLLYSAVFLKKKYQVMIKDTISINVFIYSILMSFTGLAGIVFSTTGGRLMLPFFLISIVFFLNPLELFIAGKLLSGIHIKGFKLINETRRLIKDIIDGFLKSLFNMKTTIILIIITAIHTLLSIVWYYWAFRAFDFEIPFLTVLIYNLFIRLTALLQFTPANIGVEELVSAGLFGILEQNPAYAVLVTLFLRSSTLVIMIPFGVFDTIYNFHHFSIKLPKLR